MKEKVKVYWSESEKLVYNVYHHEDFNTQNGTFGESENKTKRIEK